MDDKNDETILQTVDNESLAWDICEDYIAKDRDIFGQDSPHKFGVNTLYTKPWTYAVYVKKTEEVEEQPNLRYSSRGPRLYWAYGGARNTPARDDRAHSDLG